MMVKLLEDVPYKEWLRNNNSYKELSALEKKKLGVNLIAPYRFLRRGIREEGAHLFSLGSSARTHRNSSKLCQGTFKQNIRKPSSP